ncbi:MAG: substrate-binding domain-containing protein [Spirochaetales bacterium]|nr:substrate-binding domain-containing protein [Spirochaetales bacterium]
MVKHKKDRPTIGMLIGMLDEDYQANIWKNMVDNAIELDVNLIFIVGKALGSPYGYDYQHHLSYSLVDEQNLDGLVILTGSMCCFISMEEATMFCERFQSLPTVSMGEAVKGIPSVLLDNKFGMKEVVKHLIVDHGYKHIAHIRGPEGYQEADIRFETYKKTLEEHNLPFNPDLVVTGNFVYDKGAEAMRILLEERKQHCDAVVSANDDMALGALKYLQGKGIRVPQDIAITGFDDIKLAKVFNPPLTSVTQPMHNQARKALEIVLARINGEKVPEISYLPSKAVIRQSCGCFSPSMLYIDSTIEHQPACDDSSHMDLEENKARIIDNTTRELKAKGINNTALFDWLKEILDGMIECLKNQDYKNKAFFYLIGDLPISKTGMTKHESFWQSVIKTLYTNAVLTLKDNNAMLFLELLYKKIQIFLSEMLLRSDPFQSVNEKHMVWTLRSVGSVLISSFELNQLLEDIKEQLPYMGINMCTIAFFDGPVKKISKYFWDVPHTSQVLLAFNKHKSFTSKEGSVHFPTLELCQRKYLPTRERYSMVLMPLFFRDEHFGFIFFELGSRIETVYETLRGYISSSLKGALLFKQQKEAEELQLAAMEAAKSANKTKGEFLANMSHEIRTPMNSIIGFTELLLEEEKDPQKKDKLKIIMKAGDSLLEIINDILDFSKMEANKIEFENASFSIRDLLDDIKKMFILKASEKNVGFAIKVAESVPEYLYGDERRVNQIILNLVSNAFKFTKQGEIRIDCRYENKKTLTISVSDTGIGIAADKQQTIFSPFSQVDNSATREYFGTGLGLAISKGLAEKMGGRIFLESRIAAGSTFTIKIPLKQIAENPVTQVRKKLRDERMVQYWLKQAGGDPQLKELIIQGIQKLPERISELEQAVLHNDPDKIKKLSHDLKSVYGNLNISEIYDIFLKIDKEMNKEDARINKIIPLVSVVKELVNKIPSYYLEEIRGLTPTLRAENSNDFRVLIAEDNELNQKLIGIYLKKLNISFDIANNGRLVLDLLQEGLKNDKKYNLLLLDMQMPIMDGLEVIKIIRGHKDLKDLYVIALTAYAMKGDALKYTKAGCNGYISKPINQDKFIKTIHDVKNLVLAYAKNAKKTELDNKTKTSLKRVLSELKKNYKIFNQKKLLEIAHRLSQEQAADVAVSIKEELEKIAENFDEEGLDTLMRKMEGLINNGS